MNIKKTSFRKITEITFKEKMTLRTSKDNYICANWICVWCSSSIWIGMSYLDIPPDVFAYFLSPQQFEEFKQILQDKGEL